MHEGASSTQCGKFGLIIFDGSCGACSAFIGERREFFTRYGFEVAPLQEQWVRDLSGLDEVELLQSIHLWTPSGDVFKGVDLFEFVFRKIWWLKPLSLVLAIPPLKPLFRSTYNIIAARRRQVSKVCGLGSRALYK